MSARYVGAQGLPGRKPDEISQLKFLGQSMPRLRECTVKKWNSLPLEESLQVQYWHGLFLHTKYFDLKSIALYWLGLRKKRSQRLSLLTHHQLTQMVEEVDNWATSDGLSDIYADYLESNPKMLATLKKWNKSKNPWTRRQSIVGLYCYARMRNKVVPPKIALQLVKPLLLDHHVYVQKGVGWTLREVFNVNPKDQVKFVKKNLHLISSTAWFATSEFYPLDLKAELVQKRKTYRQKKVQSKGLVLLNTPALKKK